MNLSSIIVQVKQEHLSDVIRSIKTSDDFEYQLHDEAGRIIVTIEGKDTGEEVEKLKRLKSLKHVVSAEMVFFYSEDELEREREKLEKSEDNIPEWLNDPNADLKDIRYGGDVKGKY